MRTELFDYHLPTERIAQQPLKERDASRLLVLDRATRTWSDQTTRELPELLRVGDLLVFNDTRVFPARLRAVREQTGGQVEIFMLPREPTPCGADLQGCTDAGVGLNARTTTVRRVLTKSGGRLKVGETFALVGNVKAVLIERLGEAGDCVAFNLGEHELGAFVEGYGEVPLPPYIQRGQGPSDAQDRERYQTVFARAAGAVAAPTAGLHFSPNLLQRLEERGVELAFVTLHVGPGTFKPVKVDEIEQHHVAPEPYVVPEEAARAVTRAKAADRRVIAVGTTALRVLESCWDEEHKTLRAGTGLADLFVRPPFSFRVVSGLMTNFHLPKSSLLMLVAALASPGSVDGVKWVKAAYAHAVEQQYRFYSYGDACLVV